MEVVDKIRAFIINNPPNKTGSLSAKITRSCAKYLLQHHNNHNRPISNKKVKNMVFEMENGLWDWSFIDGRTLYFDTYGETLSAQHRLSAHSEQNAVDSFDAIIRIVDRDSWLRISQERRTIAETVHLSSNGAHISPVVAKDIVGALRQLNRIAESQTLKDVVDQHAPNPIFAAMLYGSSIETLYQRYPMSKIKSIRIREALIAAHLCSCDISNFFKNDTFENSAIEYIKSSLPPRRQGDRAFAMSVIIDAAAKRTAAKRYENIKLSLGRIELVSGLGVTAYANHASDAMKVRLKDKLEKIRFAEERWKEREKIRLAALICLNEQ